MRCLEKCLKGVPDDIVRAWAIASTFRAHANDGRWDREKCIEALSEVADLEGKVDLHTSGGDLKLGAVKGPVKAHTSGGNITLHKTEGDATLHTSGGDLRLGDIEGDLVAETSGGRRLRTLVTVSIASWLWPSKCAAAAATMKNGNKATIDK